jgi:uncharacterized membrane protein YsdA (DUF1294 family)
MKINPFPLLIAAITYLAVMNLYAFALMHSDKKRAVKNARRIPESRLFAAALLGGSLGSIFGMHVFRHKTRHLRFKIGLPLILTLQIAVVLAVYAYLS